MKTSAPTMQSDFFSRLVEKARDTASPIAPRLPSLFEPLPGAAAVVPPAQAEEPVWPVAAREPNESRPAPTAQHGPEMRASSFPPPRSQPAAIAERHDELVPGKNERLMPEAATQVALLPLAAAAHRLEDQASRLDSQRTSTKVESSLRRPDEPALKRVMEDNHEASEPRPQVPHPESGVLLPKPAAAPMPYAPAGEASRPNPPVGRGLAENPPMAEPPIPVINVTIGRVEVRAVQASPPRARAAAPRPAPLSLNDYLKQRGGSR